MKNKTRQAATNNQIRIIGGDWRGRKLSFPSIDGLRPTGDRIRETLFNWLAFDIVGLRVLDLFAGSGALGLEALSRGATSTTFVESHPTACRALTDSLDLLGATQGKVVQSSADRFLSTAAIESVDLLFLDPPFAQSLHSNTCALVEQHQILAPNAMIYMESPKDSIVAVPNNWRQLKNKETSNLRYALFQLDCDPALS